jgi:pimeloyl-ACP methyl ester carboxylesterase
MDILQWKNQGTFFQHKGHDIFFVRKGQGPALVLLHGYPTSSWDQP